MFLLSLLACAASPPAERDLPYAGAATWELGPYSLTLDGDTLAGPAGPLLTRVYDTPVASSSTLWVPADPGPGDGGIYAVRAGSDGPVVTPVLTAGRPDRLTLAPDGTLLYVSGITGLSSLWMLRDGEPRPLTNVGLRPTPGRRPDGYVPAPPRGALHFDGARVTWDDVSVEWR